MSSTARIVWILAAAFCSLLLAGCASGTDASELTSHSDLPAGDAQRGEELFRQSINRTPSCITCHTGEGGGAPGSPGLADYASVAGERVEGLSAEEYTFWAIVEPGRTTVPGYGNVMYDAYGDRLTPQQIADLIAYLLTLSES
jgi:mono/diheme cytochrome c family protein